MHHMYIFLLCDYMFTILFTSDELIDRVPHVLHEDIQYEFIVRKEKLWRTII